MKYYPELQSLLLWIEFFAAAVGILYFYKLRNSYWKWFSVYLVMIFIQEYFWLHNDSFFEISKQDYYAFFGIPIQYLFLFWLYALKALKNKNLFILCSLVYLLTHAFKGYFEPISVVYSVNLNLGTVILTVLVVLEIIKQIKNDSILEFRTNKMFYVNLAVILFYLGTYPLFTFYDVLSNEPYIEVWNGYFLYFRITGCIMYLLFIASFIWGKEES